MNQTLNIRKLHVGIRKLQQIIPVLRGVDLAIKAGQVHGLVGESGAGKTMVAKAVLGIMPGNAVIEEGSICFGQQELIGITDYKRRRLLGRHITLIPQDPMTSLNPVRRIGAQLCDVLIHHLHLSRSAAKRRALELLGQVHIHKPAQVLRQFPHELSGGMRQRVLIAIAFACQPELIIADEPTTALDVTVQRRILELIKELQRDVGTALLFVTHDLGVVAKICDHVSVIHSGRILESASAGDLFAAPRHDYTRSLMAATPRYDRPGEQLRPLAEELSLRLRREAEDYDRRKQEAYVRR